MRYLVVEIPWFVDQIPALQDDRIYKVFQYVFCLHLLKSYESQRPKGEGGQNTQPADNLRIEKTACHKVRDQCCYTGDCRENELPWIETEEYGLCITSYFFVDSYFHFL